MVCYSGAVSLKLREKRLQTYSHTVLLPKPVKFDVLSSFGDFTFFQLVLASNYIGCPKNHCFIPSSSKGLKNWKTASIII